MKKRILIPLLAGLALFCACKGRGKVESADTISSANHKSLNSPADTVRIQPKLVKTADMRFQVKSVQQATEQITALTANNNGTVVHHLMTSTAVDNVDNRKSDDSIMRVTVINSTAEMMIRIPPANMENFMNQVARLGIYVKTRKMDVSDKTLDYISTRLKLKNQNDLVSQQKNETVNKKDPDNLLAFKNNMVDQQINNRRTDDSVKNSTVVLSFYESNIINKKIIANNNLSAYTLSSYKRLGLSFENGWNVFIDVTVCIANFWVLIPLGIGVWMGIRYYKRRSLVKVDSV